MSLSPYNPNERYKKRAVSRFMALMMWFVLFTGVFYAGHLAGRENSHKVIMSLEMEKDNLFNENQTLTAQNTTLRSEVQTSKIRFEELQASFQEVLPDGPMRDLMVLVRRRLEGGTAPERLAFVINSARPPQNCADAQTRRFVVSTPDYDGADSFVSLENGLIRIQGQGASALNADGKTEAWFDQGKPVTIEFIVTGQEPTTKKGTLPIRHSLIAEGREYRFTIDTGARSFARVSFDSCDYP